MQNGLEQHLNDLSNIALTPWVLDGGAMLGCCRHVMHLRVRASLDGLFWSAKIKIVLKRNLGKA